MNTTTIRLLVIAILLCGSVGQSAPARADEVTKTATATVTFDIDGMVTNACPVLVKRAARGIDGVREVSASLKDKRAEVTYEPSKTSAREIARIIEDRTGLRATPSCGRKPQGACREAR